MYDKDFTAGGRLELFLDSEPGPPGGVWSPGQVGNMGPVVTTLRHRKATEESSQFLGSR